MIPYVRNNPNRQNPNEPQYGKVIALCFKPNNVPGHIKREVVPSLQFDVTGAIGDFHSQYFMSYTIISNLLNRIKQNKKTPVVQLESLDEVKQNIRDGKRLFKMMQVHLLDTFTAKLFKEGMNIDIYPGAIGEQVLIDGVDLNALHSGTTISIGSEVKFQVIASRTFCHKFFFDLVDPIEGRSKEELLTEATKLILNTDTTDRGTFPPHIGILVRVLSGGTINNGDEVYIDPTTSIHYNKFNTPVIPYRSKEILSVQYQWYNLEEARSIDKISTDKELYTYFNRYRFPFDEE